MKTASKVRSCVALTLVLLAIVSSAAGQTDEVRFWSDVSGKVRIQASLIEKTADWVKLRKKDGSEVTVPFAKLSRVDVEYLVAAPAPSSKPGGAKPGGTRPGIQANDRVEVL